MFVVGAFESDVGSSDVGSVDEEFVLLKRACGDGFFGCARCF